MPEYPLRPEDILHKSQLHRLLIEIIDHPILAQCLAFKGGTCAAMLGYLDRFSVDLDFDALPGSEATPLRDIFMALFTQAGFELMLAYDTALFFQLRYPSKPGQRSKLKVSASTKYVSANVYQVQYLPEIDRLMNCQTIETMFANKLMAVIDRFDQHGSIAGRDIYDIHHFFIQGYQYQPSVIIERSGCDLPTFFVKLIGFIRAHVTQTLIDEDLNALLPAPQFQRVRKIILPETLALLEYQSKLVR